MTLLNSTDLGFIFDQTKGNPNLKKKSDNYQERLLMRKCWIFGSVARRARPAPASALASVCLFTRIVTAHRTTATGSHREINF